MVGRSSRKQHYDQTGPSKRRMITGAIVLVVICIQLVRLCTNERSQDMAKKQHDNSYWLNYDPSRPATDIANYDYDNRLIIYRDTLRQAGDLDSLHWLPAAKDEKAEDDDREPLNDYEDYFGELYDYYHD